MATPTVTRTQSGTVKLPVMSLSNPTEKGPVAAIV